MKFAYGFTTVVLFVLFCVAPAQASLPKPVWHSGHILLRNETLLEGELSYNWLMETVLFHESDGRVRTFTIQQVSQFSWFDFDQHMLREFKALASVAKSPGRESLYEVCMDGSLAVVRRLRQRRGLRRRAFTHPAHYADKPTIAQSPEFFDYFVFDAGRFLTLDRFYPDIYIPLMTTYDKQLQHFARSHQLSDRTLLGQLMLINQYNALIQQDTRSASARGETNANDD